ncbi:TadE family type IV pilus minor pilin [Sciscionella sediminilitoris]|uniref:TadE family type IV pilus minor pilin n=1 Tax=Sciscionella sediminilitoris TaxID=1445613 RepID=UPI0004DF1C1C|nr:TadE family type IV pilus minor pilin [Sciscionella sp. SE31]
MVTVETAMALAAFVAVLMFGIGAVLAVLDQVRCVDAAREAARLLARGEPERAQQAVHRIAPKGGRLNVEASGDELTVRVRAEPVGGLLPGVHEEGVAYAVREPNARSG